MTNPQTALSMQTVQLIGERGKLRCGVGRDDDSQGHGGTRAQGGTDRRPEEGADQSARPGEDAGRRFEALGEGARVLIGRVSVGPVPTSFVDRWRFYLPGEGQGNHAKNVRNGAKGVGSYPCLLYTSDAADE